MSNTRVYIDVDGSMRNENGDYLREATEQEIASIDNAEGWIKCPDDME